MIRKQIIISFIRCFIRSMLGFVLVFVFVPLIVNAADQEPTVIWNMRLTIEQITESGLENNPHPLPSSRVSLFESLSPLTLDFEIDHNIKIRDENLKVEYQWKYDEKHWFGGQLAYSCRGEETGKKLVDYRLALKRHIKTGANEAILDVYDYDEMEKDLAANFKMFQVSQPDNSFWFDYKTVIPAKSSTIDYLGGETKPETFEMLKSYDDYFTGPYRYDQKVNQENDRVMVNVPSLGLIKKVSYKISYQLVTKDLALEYLPVTMDMISHPSVQKFKDSQRLRDEPYLARLKTQHPDTGRWFYGWFIHGNSIITPKVEGVDKSKVFNTIRFLRDWEAVVSGNDQNTVKYTAPDFKWTNDYDTGSPKPSWVDIPGYEIPGEADKWPTKRYIHEYLTTVERFPEFGFLYYNIVVDTRPNQYRVRMYKAKHITAEEWAKIKKSTQPYLNETGGQPEVDSGWRQPWKPDK